MASGVEMLMSPRGLNRRELAGGRRGCTVSTRMRRLGLRLRSWSTTRGIERSVETGASIHSLLPYTRAASS